MFIDTHCHLGDFENLDKTITDANTAGVEILVYAGADEKNVPHQIETVTKYKNVFCTIGIHPEFANIKPNYEQLLNHTKIIGIGEIGLDYHYGLENKSEQIELFIKQIEIAKNAKLPIAIHTRDAENDTADILYKNDIGGVMHCFTGSWEFAKKMLDRGFYFSASGILTFKNAEDLRETFKKIPNDKIVIETDSPYCAPIPYRGKQCEPAMIVETAKILGEIKNIEMVEFQEILYDNTIRLYPKMKQ